MKGLGKQKSPGIKQQAASSDVRFRVAVLRVDVTVCLSAIPILRMDCHGMSQCHPDTKNISEQKRLSLKTRTIT